MGMLSLSGKVKSKHLFDHFCFVSNDFAFFVLQVQTVRKFLALFYITLL